MSAATKLEELGRRYSDLSVRLNSAAAACDIVAWYTAHRDAGCPTCGADFKVMDPAENMYRHWSMQCKEEAPS